MNHLRKIVNTSIFALLLAAAVFGQSSLGELRGRVADSAGAVVSGANVEIKNQTTGETRTVQTNADGEFTISKLPVGAYTVTASAQGFAAASVKDVQISVAFVTEQSLTLNPQGGQETVTVTGGDVATQVNSTDQQLSTLINNQKILDLPLLSRNPSALVLLAPGTVQTDSAAGGFSVNGSRERNNNFLVDGVDNNDTDVPGIPGGIATPNIDATEEFRVITGNFNAEYGRNTGGIVTTATKRGGNAFHGGTYLYYRSDKFAARDFFDTTGKTDPLDRKQYGVSIGGPAIKDKLFFFFNYEGDRQKNGTQIFQLVPTAEARTGILRTPAATADATVNRNNGSFGVLDIRQTGFNNNLANQLGVSLPFSPTTLALLNRIFPLPNNTAGSARVSPVPGVFDYYTFGYTARNDIDSIATRVDYQLNSKNTLTGSINWSKGDYSFGAPTFPQFNDELRTPQTGAVYALNLITTISSNIVNEFRFGVNRAKATFNGPGDGGVSNAINDAVNSVFRANNVPTLSFGSANANAVNLITPFTSINNFSTQGRTTGTTTIADSLTWVSGPHTWKFGGELRSIFSNSQSNFSRQETVDFGLGTNFAFPIVRYTDAGGVTRNVPTTGAGGAINDYLSFLSGIVAFQSETQFYDRRGARVDNDLRRYRTTEYGFFGQDTWRIRPNLTLNLGLRYEFNQVPYEKDGLLSNLVDQDASGPTPAGGFAFKTVGKNSDNPGIKLWDNDWNNFAPRFGFAYSPNFGDGFLGKLFGGPGKSSIRGGYGLFYDRVFTNLFSNSSGNPPFSTAIFEIPLNGSGGFLIDDTPRLATRPSTNLVQDGDELGLAVIFPTARNNTLQKKFVTPNSASWNFGFQRELGNQFLLEIDYVGTKGTNLIRSVDAQLTSVARVNAIRGTHTAISTSTRTNYLNGTLNQAFGQNSAFLITSIGNSNYNAMQLRLTKTLSNKRFGTGQIQGFYTWSHSIDDAADALITGTSDRSLPRDSSGFAGGLRLERGDSSFDARHRFVMNFIYELPFRSTNGFINRLIGNWTLSGIYQAQTGYPFSVFMNGVDRQGTGLSARASYANGSNGFASNRTSANARVYTGPDRSLFASSVPLDGNQGTVGRGAFRGPKYANFDFSLIKRIPITERMRFTMRADFFNLFNKVNLAVPVSDVNSANFGLSTTAGPARIIQFAGRFDF
ncbi:MAG: TonB-dependent receptor [Acidobacteria bacterium]|nr:TonB-dependent receptor [Acidobacteriota bacterium]